jgi:hypothetical protein
MSNQFQFLLKTQNSQNLRPPQERKAIGKKYCLLTKISFWNMIAVKAVRVHNYTCALPSRMKMKKIVVVD